MSEIITKEINILPDRSLMPKIGQTGYSVSQAIAELVDNAIDARKDDETLTVEVVFDPHRKVLQVKDDGSGMDEQEAANAIRLAHSEKKDRLGEFGLGLKTAATSLGKSFEIMTTKEGSDEEYIINYDEAEWLDRGDWNKHKMKVKTGVNTKRSGTTITIKSLIFGIYPNLPGNVRKDLATRFAPYIEAGQARIKINTKWCEPELLDLNVDYYPPDGKQHFEFTLESGNKVRGWRGLLRKGSEKGEYGFRVFRRGRLIMQYAKLGFNPHPENRQIIGEIHLDHVPVTHNKREFIQESPLYREIIAEDGIFWNFMRELVREARSSVRKTQIDQGILDKIAAQKENIMRAIKSLPELREYAFPDLADKISSRHEGSEGTDELEIEKRDPRETVTVTEEPEPQDEHTRRPKKMHVRRTYYIIIHGKRFKFEHTFADLKNEDVLKDKTIDEEQGIHIFTNTSFPAFANTKDHVFYAVWNIAEAIAEVMIETNNRSKDEILRVRDLILKKTSEIAREIDEVAREKQAAERLKREYEEKVARIQDLESRGVAASV